MPRIAELESAVRNHAECIAKDTSKTEIPALRRTLESLSVELQLEKRRSNAKIITLEKLEQEINKMNDEQSDRLSGIEQKMMTLQHLKRDIEDNGDEQSKQFSSY